MFNQNIINSHHSNNMEDLPCIASYSFTTLTTSCNTVVVEDPQFILSLQFVLNDVVISKAFFFNLMMFNYYQLWTCDRSINRLSGFTNNFKKLLLL